MLETCFCYQIIPVPIGSFLQYGSYTEGFSTCTIACHVQENLYPNEGRHREDIFILVYKLATTPVLPLTLGWASGLFTRISLSLFKFGKDACIIAATAIAWSCYYNWRAPPALCCIEDFKIIRLIDR